MEKAISIRCTGADNFDIEDLHPFQDDIKTMTPSTLKKLENVIISQGFSEPIAVWQNDGRNWILNGHQRHTALQSLRSRGWFVPPVPVALVDAADEDDARKKVITLASQFGDFNQDHLLEFVAKAKLDTDWLKNNARLAAGDFKWPVLVTPTDEDETPEPSPVEIVQRGELFILGDHRLMCGDATDMDDVARLMDGKKADAMITDPPYGIQYQSNYRKDKFDKIQNDDVVLSDWTLPAEKFVSGWIIFFIGWQRMSEWLSVGSKFGALTNILIWKKSAAMGNLSGSFSPTYEMALAYNRGAKLAGSTRPSAIIECNIDSASTFVHPTQKPINLFEQIMNAIPSANLLDLFGGSGSTLMACEKTKRNCFMMELDPIYCGLILDRWESVTGKTACRDDGESWQSIKNLRTD